MRRAACYAGCSLVPELADVSTCSDDFGVVGNDADGSIRFQDSQLDFGDASDPMLAHGHLHFRSLQPLLLKVGYDKLPILHQNSGSTPNEPSPPLASQTEDADEFVRTEDHERGQEPRWEGCIRTDHCVLHGIRDEQDHHQIEHSHLTEFLPISRSPTRMAR